jgi:hypothetical protein
MIDELIAILVGFLLIIFRKWFAKECISFQNTVWGFNFGKKEIKITEIVTVVVGATAILFGLLDLGLRDILFNLTR